MFHLNYKTAVIPISENSERVEHAKIWEWKERIIFQRHGIHFFTLENNKLTV